MSHAPVSVENSTQRARHMTPPGRSTAERERAMLSRLEHLPGSDVTKTDGGARFHKFQDRNERNKAEMQTYPQRAPGL